MERGASDVEAGKKSSDAAGLNAPDATGSASCSPSFALSVVSAVWFLGSLATATLGIYYLSESNYAPPPIPVGHVMANLIVIPGAALTLGSVSSLAAVHGAVGCAPKHRGHAARMSFTLVWGLAFVAGGYFRFWTAHPYSLPSCPCPAFHAKLDDVCVPCPGFVAGVCDTEDCVCGAEGTCSEITAQCVCEKRLQAGKARDGEQSKTVVPGAAD